MDLLEDDVQAFEHFVLWVDERRIDISMEIPSEVSLKDDKDDLLRLACVRCSTFTYLVTNTTFPL